MFRECAPGEALRRGAHAFLWTGTLKATAIFAAAFPIVFVLRRASASARYFVWSSALATALAVPLLSLSLRPWHVPLAPPDPAISRVRLAVDLPASHPPGASEVVGAVSEAVEVVGKGPRAASSGAPRRIRVGGNVQATKLLHMTKPVYPDAAQAAGIEGTVLLHAVISMQGNLLGVAVLNTSVDPRLARAAMEAVTTWQYEPTLLNGAPVEVVTTITVNFRLEH